MTAVERLTTLLVDPNNIGWALQVAETEAVLACRLIARKTEPLEKMITRVQTARQEMRHLPEFDYGERARLLLQRLGCQSAVGFCTFHSIYMCQGKGCL